MVGHGFRMNGHYAICFHDYNQALKDIQRLIQANAPPWMTPTHVVDCIQHDSVQSHWHTTPIHEGDWYFCRWEGIYRILQVDSAYWNDVDLKSEPEQGCLGRPSIDKEAQKVARADGCDFFIPDPIRYGKITRS